MTFLNYLNVSNELESSIENEMSILADDVAGSVEGKLHAHIQLINSAKTTIESADSLMTREQFIRYVQQLLPFNKETYGMGLWLEEDVAKGEIFGPYAYKEEEKLSLRMLMKILPIIFTSKNGIAIVSNLIR